MWLRHVAVASVPNEEPSCQGGLGPQRGTELRHNGEGPPSLPPSPFDFGPVANRAPPRRPTALNGACRRSTRLAGAVFITARFACALR